MKVGVCHRRAADKHWASSRRRPADVSLLTDWFWKQECREQSCSLLHSNNSALIFS